MHKINIPTCACTLMSLCTHTHTHTHICTYTLLFRYIIPFNEVIDWSLVSLDIDERQLLQVPHIVRSIPPEQLLSMRLQTQFIWDTYLSSVEKIIMTTIEVEFFLFIECMYCTMLMYPTKHCACLCCMYRPLVCVCVCMWVECAMK